MMDWWRRHHHHHHHHHRHLHHRSHHCSQWGLLIWMTLLVFVQPALSQDTDLCQPEFGYEKLMRIEEDTPPGTVILVLNTKGSSSEVTLTMPDNDLFAFNATSQQLSVKGQLDADNAVSTYVILEITCTNPTNQQIPIQITITIKDVNDNPPQFTQDHFYVDVPETMGVNKVFESNVAATDADASVANNAIHYTIEDGPYSNYVQFPDPVNSYLVLSRPLDFETLPNFTVTVVATNQRNTEKPLNSTAQLTIRVIDEDDLNPVFSSPLYEGVILETAQLNSLVNVTPSIYAVDADVTLNEPVFYSFHDELFLCDQDAQTSQQMFTIDNETAEVTLMGAVSPSKVSVVVQATQRNNPSRYGVAMLVITVVSVNSNAPQFTGELYTAFVSEATPVGTVVLFVSATDQDFGSSIQYSIVDDNPHFTIEEDSGAILLKTLLDFEATEFHSFVVKASDGSMESTATVEVNVVDANDNSPVITDQQLTFDVDRHNTSVIAVIQATDADAETKLSFRLENHVSLFTIDEEDGVLRLSDPAAASSVEETLHTLLITVSDNGTSPRHTSTLATVRFPPLPTTTPIPSPTTASSPSTQPPPTTTTTTRTSTTATTTTTTGEAGTAAMAGVGDIVAIVLGIAAALLLVVVVVLVILLCRRRGQNAEQLDKAKVNRSRDPKGLKFKHAGGQRGSRLDDMPFPGEEDSFDGRTPIQDNPLSYKEAAGAFNPAFVAYAGEGDRQSDQHMDEIQIETAVIPFQASDAFNNNSNNRNHNHHHHHLPTEMYQHDDSSDYGDTLPMARPHASMVPPDSSTSTESLSTTRTTNSSADGGRGAAAKQLLIGNGVTSFGTTSFGKNPAAAAAGMGGGGGLDPTLPAVSVESLNPDLSVTPPLPPPPPPQDHKSELTVYF